MAADAAESRIPMRVEWAIPCRYAELSSDGTATIVGAGVDWIEVPSVPAGVIVVLAVRLVGTYQETVDVRNHELISSVLDPEMAELAQVSVSFAAQLGEGHPEGWEGRMILPRVVNRFVAAAEGDYTLDLCVDGGSHHTLPFSVRTGKT